MIDWHKGDHTTISQKVWMMFSLSAQLELKTIQQNFVEMIFQCNSKRWIKWHLCRSKRKTNSKGECPLFVIEWTSAPKMLVKSSIILWLTRSKDRITFVLWADVALTGNKVVYLSVCTRKNDTPHRNIEKGQISNFAYTSQIESMCMVHDCAAYSKVDGESCKNAEEANNFAGAISKILIKYSVESSEPQITVIEFIVAQHTNNSKSYIMLMIFAIQLAKSIILETFFLSFALRTIIQRIQILRNNTIHCHSIFNEKLTSTIK